MIVEIDGLEKRYGALRALAGVTLAIEGGTVGLLGPNGAGKSTLLKVMLGLLPFDAGSMRVLGVDVAAAPLSVRSRVGYMPEGDAVIPDLSALDFATFAAELCGLPAAEAKSRAHMVLEYVGLGEARYRKLGSYSTGMRQRAKLAQALAGDPRLILLDEPTSGLDPQGRDEMVELIQDLPKRTGAHLILSTHILPDVEKTCSQVVVLREGSVLYSGALELLIASEKNVYEVRVKGDPAPLARALEEAGCTVAREGSTLHVRAPEGADADLVFRTAPRVGAQIRHLAPLANTLERAFLKAVRDGEAPKAA
ncbi:MAG: ABC transporter ATP-binding protein [Deltaproteobacteria bacterium]|nr:ABC transporter ATP-binding protein [Deltaproteobacteria bacterium]